MDFEQLKNSIERATRKAFVDVFEKHGSEGIYAFALYSDGGAMTVCPATNTVEHLEGADPKELANYRFEPAEWKYEAVGAEDEFGEICQALRNELAEMEDDDEAFERFQTRLFESCVEVLEKLKNEKFFSHITGQELFLNFTVSDTDNEEKEIKRWIERLNDNPYRDEYLKWMKSWGK